MEAFLLDDEFVIAPKPVRTKATTRTTSISEVLALDLTYSSLVDEWCVTLLRLSLGRTHVDSPLFLTKREYPMVIDNLRIRY